MKRAWIFGLGVSGLSAARLLLAHDTKLVLFDAKDTEELRERLSDVDHPLVDICLGEEKALRMMQNAGRGVMPDFCVVSPGVPDTSPWLQLARERQIPILSELELGARHVNCPMLAITGSKGKSTMAKLCHDTLKAAGKRVAIGGNYGTPLCDLAEISADLDWLVVEVSSFQLEHVVTFHPKIGVLLNLQPDHLDRHGSLDAYAAIKARLFACMGINDTAIIHEPDTRHVSHSATGPRHITFGSGKNAAFRFEDHHLFDSNTSPVLDLSGSYFDNPILGKSAAATLAAMRACGVADLFLEIAIRTFSPLPHRMSRITTIDGVSYINDSKATSLSALVAGVQMCAGPVRLLAGGLLKESDLQHPKQVLAKQVVAVYVFGKFAMTLKEAWQDVVRCEPCNTLEEALRKAAKEAETGDTVLLSPGCASYDQFKNFEDRGTQFIRIVESLKDERKSKR
jgi:UDP-N-acetylmuramoylalanine--D-glutamate ligase